MFNFKQSIHDPQELDIIKNGTVLSISFKPNSGSIMTVLEVVRVNQKYSVAFIGTINNFKPEQIILKKITDVIRKGGQTFIMFDSGAFLSFS